METRKLLKKGASFLKKAGLSQPEAEREVLLTLAHLLKLRPTEVFLRKEVSERTESRFFEILKKRAQGIPLAYLLGEVEFFGRPFKVAPGVLIPRPETEILVETVLKILANQKGRLLELGVGSGCLALTLALEAPKFKVFGVEIKKEALRIACENRKRFGLEERVYFFQGDWFRPLKPGPLFLAIVSNPPYIAPEEWDTLPIEVREHEPREALWGGEEGLEFIARTLTEAPDYLVKEGFVFLEIGYQQARAAKMLAEDLGYRVSLEKDLLGYWRVLIAQRRPRAFFRITSS